MSGIPAFKAQPDTGSSYVPNMTQHHHVGQDGTVTVQFPNTVVDGSLLMAALTTVAATEYDDLGVEIAEPFGRTLALTSTDADGVLIVHGTDFLGQQMSQQVTFSSNAGATTKAFKTVDKIVTTTNAGDVVINTGSGYGLPFCAVEIVREVVDGVASTEGTITAAVSTAPSTTTGDVRGTFNPNTAGNGVKDISVTYIATADLTGGLYGQPQV